MFTIKTCKFLSRYQKIHNLIKLFIECNLRKINIKRPVVALTNKKNNIHIIKT